MNLLFGKAFLKTAFCRSIVEGGAWDVISRVFCADRQVCLSENALTGVMFVLGGMKVSRSILYTEETKELVDRIEQELANKDRADPRVKMMWEGVEYARSHMSSSPRTPPQKRIRVA
jgi:hypothetical protein